MSGLPDTTVERVRAIAKHLKYIDSENLQIFIDDAIQEVSDANVPANHKERLQRYLAAHLATLDIRRPTQYSAADLSINYPAMSALAKDLERTQYGQEYKRLLNRIRGGFLRVM